MIFKHLELRLMLQLSYIKKVKVKSKYKFIKQVKINQTNIKSHKVTDLTS